MKKNPMPKIGYLILGCIAIVIIGAVVFGRTEKSLEQMVDEANKSCPIPFGEGAGFVVRICIKDGFLTYWIIYNQDNIDVQAYRQHPDIAKDIFLLCFYSMNGQNGPGSTYMEPLLEHKLGVKFIACDEKGDFVCELSPEYIANKKSEIEHNPTEALRDALTLKMEIESKSLPQEIGEGMTMIKCEIAGNDIVITCSIDEKRFDMESFKILSSQFVKIMIESANEGDIVMANMLNMCKISKYGLIFRFKGDNGGNYDLKFPNNIIQDEFNIKK